MFQLRKYFTRPPLPANSISTSLSHSKSAQCLGPLNSLQKLAIKLPSLLSWPGCRSVNVNVLKTSTRQDKIQKSVFWTMSVKYGISFQLKSLVKSSLQYVPHSYNFNQSMVSYNPLKCVGLLSSVSWILDAGHPPHTTCCSYNWTVSIKKSSIKSVNHTQPYLVLKMQIC